MRYELGSFTLHVGRDMHRFTEDTCADCGYPIPSWWPVRWNYSDGTRHYLCAFRHARKQEASKP
jgi:hypothetical protein